MQKPGRITKSNGLYSIRNKLEPFNRRTRLYTEILFFYDRMNPPFSKTWLFISDERGAPFFEEIEKSMKSCNHVKTFAL